MCKSPELVTGIYNRNNDDLLIRPEVYGVNVLVNTINDGGYIAGDGSVTKDSKPLKDNVVLPYNSKSSETLLRSMFHKSSHVEKDAIASLVMRELESEIHDGTLYIPIKHTYNYTNVCNSMRNTKYAIAIINNLIEVTGVSEFIQYDSLRVHIEDTLGNMLLGDGSIDIIALYKYVIPDKVNRVVIDVPTMDTVMVEYSVSSTNDITVVGYVNEAIKTITVLLNNHGVSKEIPINSDTFILQGVNNGKQYNLSIVTNDYVGDNSDNIIITRSCGKREVVAPSWSSLIMIDGEEYRITIADSEFLTDMLIRSIDNDR